MWSLKGAMSVPLAMASTVAWRMVTVSLTGSSGPDGSTTSRQTRLLRIACGEDGGCKRGCGAALVPVVLTVILGVVFGGAASGAGAAFGVSSLSSVMVRLRRGGIKSPASSLGFGGSGWAFFLSGDDLRGAGILAAKILLHLSAAIFRQRLATAFVQLVQAICLALSFFLGYRRGHALTVLKHHVLAVVRIIWIAHIIKNSITIVVTL